MPPGVGAGTRTRAADAILTVLMPCTQPHWPFFQAALESVLDQTCSHWELLVICEPGEEELIWQETTRCTRADRRVRVLVNEGRYLSGALNTGMRSAATEFVAILLGDDLLAPNAIEVLERDIRRHPGCGFFHSSRRVINHKGEFISSVYPARESFAIQEFKQWSPVKHLFCFLRETALAIGGIDEGLGLHGADDYDFPWCMAEAGCVFRAIPECLYFYRDHREHFRLTTHIPLAVQLGELRKIWRKHGMTEEEIETQMENRLSGYLNQALYADWDDKRRKEQSGFDIRTGWRARYK